MCEGPHVQLYIYICVCGVHLDAYPIAPHEANPNGTAQHQEGTCHLPQVYIQTNGSWGG